MSFIRASGGGDLLFFSISIINPSFFFLRKEKVRRPAAQKTLEESFFPSE